MTTDFMKAPVGAAAMEACGACGMETGVVMIKKKGSAKGEYTGPRLIQNPEARCEFCQFVGAWMAQEGHDPQKDGKVCAGKVVKRVEGGAEELVAFIVSTEHDDRNKHLVDGTKFELRHGTVILAEPGQGMSYKLVEVLKPGI